MAGGRCRYFCLCRHFGPCAAFAAKSDGKDSGQMIRLYRCGPSCVCIISCQGSPMQRTDVTEVVRRRCGIATLHRPFDRSAFSNMLSKNEQARVSRAALQQVRHV